MTDTYTINLSRTTSRRRGNPTGLRRVASRMRHQPTAVVAFAFIVLLAVVAITAPLLAPYDPTQTHYDNVLEGPSAQFWFGTDDLGRDIFSQLLYGTRVALVVAAGSVLIAMLIGVPIGLLLGYRGGWSDRIGTRFVDIADALPGMLVALAVIAILGQGLWTLVLAIGLIFCMNFARLTRAVTLAERNKLYVEAATVAGLRSTAILFRQVLPNLVGALIIQAAVFLGSAIMLESALSFLGLGLPSGTPSWGAMLSLAIEQQQVHPFLSFPPGIAIVLTVLAFNLFGDGLNDALTAGRGRARKAKPLAATTDPKGAASAPTAAAVLSQSADVPVGALDPGLAAPDAPAPFSDEAEAAPHSDPAGDEAVAGSVLEVRGLTVDLQRPDGRRDPLIEDIHFAIRRGEVVGLLGESGSGKSIFAKATLGLLPPATRLAAGSIRLNGEELAFRTERQLRSVRGTGIGAVFQDPLTAFSPVHTVGSQLIEPLQIHKGLSKRAARRRAIELLERVGVTNAAARLDHYPHQFSGGLAQRAAIAMALAAEPKLLIADEATSALDVTTQSQVLDLLLDLRDEYDMGILLITHDLGVVAETCDRAAVMYAGQIVETGGVRELFERPRHPYTAALLAANPSTEAHVDRLPTIPGRVPLAGEWPAGCHFASRCEFARDECTVARIPLQADVRCVRAESLVLEGVAR